MVPDCFFYMASSANRTWSTESGVDCRVIGVVSIASAFVSAASELAVAIFGLGGARVTCNILAMGQPTILSRAEAGHECCEGCHGPRVHNKLTP